MKRPIEKYGWEESKEKLTGYEWNYERIKGGGLFIHRELLSFDTKGNIYLRTDRDMLFEELQAIYETAKQIKEKYE